MNRIIHIYVSEDEYDLFTSLLEQIQHGVEDEEHNLITPLKLSDEQFNTLIGFANKLCK